jgi:hypothetical protein
MPRRQPIQIGQKPEHHRNLGARPRRDAVPVAVDSDDLDVLEQQTRVSQ